MGSTSKFALALMSCLAVAATNGCAADPVEPVPVARVSTARLHGLAAFPAAVTAVVGFDVPALASSPLVQRHVGELLAREPEAARLLREFATMCGLTPEVDIDELLVGVEADGGAMLVARGRFEELRIVACVGTAVAAKGGTVEPRPGEPTPHYVVHGSPGEKDHFLGFAAPRTVIVSDRELLMKQALDAKAPRLMAQAGLAAQVKSVSASGAAAWGAGLVPPGVGERLVALTGGRVVRPPTTIAVRVELTTGVAAQLEVELESPADAEALAAFVREQLAQYVVIAHAAGLGDVAGKVTVETEAKRMWIAGRLDEQDLIRIEPRINAVVQLSRPDAGKP